MTDKEKVDLLIEDYKLVAAEAKGYLVEMMRCFLYASVVLAIGLGYGEGSIEKIIKYMPPAFIGLLLYFLSLQFMYINANRYKAQIEHKINSIAKDRLLAFELQYKPQLLKTGFLPIGKKAKRILPLPNTMLGIIVVLAFLFLSIKSNFTIKEENLSKIYWFLGGFLIVFFIYVFLIIPRVIEKYQKRQKWIDDNYL